MNRFSKRLLRILVLLGIWFCVVYIISFSLSISGLISSDLNEVNKPPDINLLTVHSNNSIQTSVGRKKFLRNLPEVPKIFEGQTDSRLPQSSACARYPTAFDIHFSNIYWQACKTNKQFLIYSEFHV